MEILARHFLLRYLLDKHILTTFFVMLLLSCIDKDNREVLIPGKFVVSWDNSIFTNEFGEKQKSYYSDLTLLINQDKTYKFSFDFDSNKQTEGEWKFEGAKYQKLLELKVRKNYWVGIGACIDTGQIFTYPLQLLDDDGEVMRLTFKKIENFH
jgi:hypothetical protein